MRRNEIFTTKKYEIFKKLPGNRTINAKNLREIVENMKVEYNPVPAIVNEKMEVIDGQHRIEAAKMLSFPVDYIMRTGWGLRHAQRLNKVSKHWDFRDYAESFIESGNKHYIDFISFQDKYRFASAITLALLLGTNSIGGPEGQNFIDGNFKVKNYAEAEKFAQQIVEIGLYFEKTRKPKFISSMLRAMKTKGYSQKQFIHKLQKFPTLMVDCPSPEEFLKRIEFVYKYQSKGEKLRFF